MQTPLTIPVPVLRLPRGPDGFSRGFAPNGRRAPLKEVIPEISASSLAQESRESQEQRARAALRERYLRSLLAMVGRQVLNFGALGPTKFGPPLGFWEKLQAALTS
ncbi:PREDICTED: gem-associated protein 7 isoform X2 [Condylura cristata]|uniref:gem-associated protein 7 isoform X2 n=1 Tax=Condylura cristata TaxID=143302 RepID=UPI000642ED66|nr:PREDICTED: gem-associated protein 7 isoform X2 [Condylura cristata]